VIFSQICSLACMIAIKYLYLTLWMETLFFIQSMVRNPKGLLGGMTELLLKRLLLRYIQVKVSQLLTVGTNPADLATRLIVSLMVVDVIQTPDPMETVILLHIIAEQL
jgi:hypothetical protein